MMRVARLIGPGASAGLAGLASSGGFEVMQVLPATEAQLRRLLADRSCPVAVLALDVAAAGAGYATAVLSDSQGQARKLNVQPLGQVLAQSGVRVAILASAASADVCLAVAEAWVAKGVGAVVILPAQVSCSPLLSALARGDDVNRGVGLNSVGLGTGTRLTVCGNGGLSLGAAAPDPQPAPSPPPVASASVAAATLRREDASAILRAKRDADRFDVFLCHNSAEKPAVKRMGQRLKEYGILPWLDEWELPPGQPWQPLLEQQIARIGSAAVFIGASGISPWHQQEMRGFISEFVERRVPVIPVLLSDAPAKPDLPVFLRQMTWVDFRSAEPDPFERLMWGITGQRPE